VEWRRERIIIMQGGHSNPSPPLLSSMGNKEKWERSQRRSYIEIIR
jgi:hypothetical protein